MITPEGRGPDGWYYDYAGADTFEVWADVAARYSLDPDWTAIAGYSMGGYGTYKFATQFPDLFAKAQPTVGPPGLGIWAPPADPQPGGAQSNTNRMLASVRNIPFLIWNAAQRRARAARRARRRRRTASTRSATATSSIVFNPAEHLTLAINDQYAPAAAFLGTHEGGPQPGARDLRLQPDDGLPGRRDGGGPRLLGLGLTLRDSSGHRAARHDRRALGGLRRRRPDAVRARPRAPAR